jgi:hypothetical protein
MAVVGLVHLHEKNGERRMTRQTTLRCNKALELYLRGVIDKIVLTSYSDWQNSRHTFLARNYFHLNGVRLDDILFNAMGYFYTIGEIVACENIVAPKDKIISVTSWYHVPRVWCLWRLRGRKVRVIPAGGGGVIDVLTEPLKMFIILGQVKNPPKATALV